MAGDCSTKMYCPLCKQITVCVAMEYTPDVGDLRASVQHAKHPDLKWFERKRQCGSCGSSFITAEISRYYIFELVKLRDTLRAIKGTATVSIEEAKSLSRSLELLSEQLKNK